MSRKILLVDRGNPASANPPLASALRDEGYIVDCLTVPYDARAHGLLHILFASVRLRTYDAIAVSEYRLAWALCVRLIFTFARARLVVVGFNQSSRLYRTSVAWLDRLLNLIWRRVGFVIVHSRDEARLFHRLHAIPEDRFHFVHWGYDLPALADDYRPPFDDYVCMIGRNNRDVATFCAAVDRAGINGILVTSRQMARQMPAPPSERVRLLVDIPMDECLAIVARSWAHLVLLVDGERGAGHISAVSAMLLGKAHIFSDVDTLADYLIDGFNGIAVPLRDVAAIADALVRLRDDRPLRERMAGNGHDLAAEWMSHEAPTRQLSAVVIAAAEGRSFEQDNAWDRARAGIATA